MKVMSIASTINTGKLRTTNTVKWNLISNLLNDFHSNSNEEQSASETEDVDMDGNEQDEEDSSDQNMTKDVFTPENNAILEITSSARVDESISPCGIARAPAVRLSHFQFQ